MFFHRTLLFEMAQLEFRRGVSWVAFIEAQSILFKKPYPWGAAVRGIIEFVILLSQLTSYSHSKLNLTSPYLRLSSFIKQNLRGSDPTVRHFSLPVHIQ